MHPIRTLTRPEELEAYTAELRSMPSPRVALDLEGDQGSVRYHYSIAILQVYDGEKPVIIDVVRIGNHDTVRAFLSDVSIVKVMFSASNDVFMAQNCLGCTIESIRDIAVAQKLLGQKINLSDHIGIDKDKKDAFQRANWLTRPIRPDLAEYAINDVLSLLKMESALCAELEEKGLTAQYLRGCAELSANDYRIDQLGLYRERFPGYRRLPGKKRELAKIVWIAREVIGERLDCPVGYILSKKAMPYIAEDEASLSERLLEEINRNRRDHKRMHKDFVDSCVERAKILAREKTGP